LISRSYCERPYTILERRTALLRALESPQPYLLPVVTDDAWPQGLPRSTAFLDLRKISVSEIATHVVRKVRGVEQAIALPVDGSPKIVPLQGVDSSVSPGSSHTGVRFELVRLTPDSRPWIESPNRFAVKNGLELAYGTTKVSDRLAHVSETWWHVFSGCLYGDPILDVTISNSSEEPLLLSCIGIRFSSVADHKPGFFGGESCHQVIPPEVPLAATFCLELPDLMTTFYEAEKAGRVSENARGGLAKILDVNALAFAELPNPVRLERKMLYRYKMTLTDYQPLVPAEAVVRLWLRTGSGEWSSEPILIEYNVGVNDIGRARDGSLRRRLVEITAERFWRAAGQPVGRDEEFWLRAEHEVISLQAHKNWELHQQGATAPYTRPSSPQDCWDSAARAHNRLMINARTRPL
jgi:hypothetical protein